MEKNQGGIHDSHLLLDLCLLDNSFACLLHTYQCINICRPKFSVRQCTMIPCCISHHRNSTTLGGDVVRWQLGNIKCVSGKVDFLSRAHKRCILKTWYEISSVGICIQLWDTGKQNLLLVLFPKLLVLFAIKAKPKLPYHLVLQVPELLVSYETVLMMCGTNTLGNVSKVSHFL